MEKKSVLAKSESNIPKKKVVSKPSSALKKENIKPPSSKSKKGGKQSVSKY